MKHFITSSLLSLILFSCNTQSDPSIIGKWQSASNKNITIEFKENGDYIFCINNNCTEDQNNLHYMFDRSATEFNLHFDELSKDTVIQFGKLSFINSNKINIELYDEEKAFQSKNEFERMK